jgi:hypothetical protein
LFDYIDMFYNQGRVDRRRPGASGRPRPSAGVPLRQRSSPVHQVTPTGQPTARVLASRARRLTTDVDWTGGQGMAWLVDIWKLMFWIPAVASAATGWFALGSGTIVRPIPLALWFLTSLLLQFASEPLSMAWAAGLLVQSALAIYLSVRLKLDA